MLGLDLPQQMADHHNQSPRQMRLTVLSDSVSPRTGSVNPRTGSVNPRTGSVTPRTGAGQGFKLREIVKFQKATVAKQDPPAKANAVHRSISTPTRPLLFGNSQPAESAGRAYYTQSGTDSISTPTRPLLFGKSQTAETAERAHYTHSRTDDEGHPLSARSNLWRLPPLESTEPQPQAQFNADIKGEAEQLQSPSSLHELNQSIKSLHVELSQMSLSVRSVMCHEIGEMRQSMQDIIRKELEVSMRSLHVQQEAQCEPQEPSGKASEWQQKQRSCNQQPEADELCPSISVGMPISVTQDVKLLEKAVLDCNMDWPNASPGRLWTSNLGKSGCITQVDASVNTAMVSNDIGWVPVGALITKQGQVLQSSWSTSGKQKVSLDLSTNGPMEQQALMEKDEEVKVMHSSLHQQKIGPKPITASTLVQEHTPEHSSTDAIKSIPTSQIQMHSDLSTPLLDGSTQDLEGERTNLSKTGEEIGCEPDNCQPWRRKSIGSLFGIDVSQSPHGSRLGIETDSSSSRWGRVQRKRSMLRVGKSVETDVVKRILQAALVDDESNMEDLYNKSGLWQSMAREGSRFSFASHMVVAANVIWIGIDEDINQADVLCEAPALSQVMNNIFCTFFVFETMVLFLAFQNKMKAFSQKKFLFDLMLTLFMVWETWIEVLLYLVFDSKGTSNSAFATQLFRLFRLFRLTRVPRIVRLSMHVPELMIMIKGMATAIRSVTVIFSFLFFTIFIFGILFTELFKDIDHFKESFGTVVQSMYTLLSTILCGVDADFLKSVFAESVVHFAIYLLFLVIAMFTLMNMLIGVLCDVVATVRQAEVDHIYFQHLDHEVSQIVEAIDMDKNGWISKTEWEKVLTNKEVLKAFDAIGVDVAAFAGLQHFVFKDEDELSTSEFCQLIAQFRGDRAVTVKDLVDTHKFISMEIDSIASTVQDSMEIGFAMHS